MLSELSIEEWVAMYEKKSGHGVEGRRQRIRDPECGRDTTTGDTLEAKCY